MSSAKRSLVLTVIGRDRPGLVDELANEIVVDVEVHSDDARARGAA